MMIPRIIIMYLFVVIILCGIADIYCVYAWSVARSVPSLPTHTSSTSTSLFAVQDKISGLGLGLGLQWDSTPIEKRETNDSNINGKNTNGKKEQQRVPFIIQKIGRGNKSEIEEITNVCIDVFFNEQKDKKKKAPPWKAFQLAYLGNMQRSDILARNTFKRDMNCDLIIARRVYPAETSQLVDLIDDDKKQSNNIIGDTSQIYNLDQLLKTTQSNGGREVYISGEVIGYCEVTEKNFGLGGKFSNTKTMKSPSNKKKKKSVSEKPRPYLGNLSVVDYARNSGVGSKLVDTCEEVVQSWNGKHTEIVLQVEEDNKAAIQFYKRRGYEFVFADPTCRRYDTSGFILKETRITKYAMRKQLDTDERNESQSNSDEKSGESSKKIRNFFFVQ